MPELFGKGHLRITKRDVVYMRADGSYVEVFIGTECGLKSHTCSMNLGYLASFFPPERFFRLSRSLVVNLDHVERIEKDRLYLNMTQHPPLLPETNHKELLRRLTVVKTP